MMVRVVMAVVDRRHVVVEHGSEVEWVRFHRCWGATREPMMGCDEPVLGCDEPVLGCNLDGASGGAISAMLGCDEPVLGCDETGASGAMGILLSLFLSLSLIFLRWKSFEGKIEPELVLWAKRVIFKST